MNKHLIAAALFVTALTGCEQKTTEVEEVIRKVRYIELAAVGDRQTRTFSGVTKAALETDLSFKVSGLLTDLEVNVGDVIELGQTVARVDPTDYEVSLREAEAGLERAKAEERNAAASFDRTRELYENRNASRNDLDTARATAESVSAQVRAMAQQVEAVRLQLSYTRLTSPQLCSVAQRYVEVNQNVSAGQSIMRVNCGDCPEIQVDVPGVYIGRVRDGADVEVKVAALAKQTFRGVVTEIGVGTSQSRSIYSVTVQLSDGCKQVRSGMAADVRMVLEGDSIEENKLRVPLVSVGEDREGNFVYVLEAAGEGGDLYIAKRRGVTLGQPDAQGVEIVAGVSVGELIATAGVRRLIDGQTVNLLSQGS